MNNTSTKIQTRVQFFEFSSFSPEDDFDSPTFTFNKQLDLKFLNSFYAGNYEDLAFAFSAFKNYTVKTAFQLIQSGFREDWKSFKYYLHIIIPGFQMVGFTEMSNYFKNLETADLSFNNSADKTLFLEFLKFTFRDCVTIIQSEQKRLNFFLQNTI